MKRKTVAFTLAEVLITLGIIGVVSALTLPTLITNLQDRQFKTAFKKNISDISQAMKLVYNETEETYTNVDWVQMPIYFCKLKNYLKVQNSGIDCTNVKDDTVFTSSYDWESNPKISWHKDYKWYDKKGNPQSLNPGYPKLTILLLNGGMINFNCYNAIFVDVNGEKGPNTIGRDIYYMYFTDGATSPSIGFGKRNTVRPNACSAGIINTATPDLNKDNILEDCKNGSGWGCSFILD